MKRGKIKIGNSENKNDLAHRDLNFKDKSLFKNN